MIKAPFFIIGCGRSGTTLLRTLLNRHPDIAIPLESLFITDYLKVASRFGISFLKSMLVKEPEIREWGITAHLEDLQDCETIPEAIKKLHHVYLAKKGKRRWGQKTPRFVRSLDLLLEHFPDAQFIHLIRDPRAVVSSLIQSDVHRSNAYHASLRWRMDVRKGLDFEKRHQDRVLRVTYESMVTEVSSNIRSILQFLALPYDPSIEDSEEPVSSEYSQFYKNIHANIDRNATDTYINKWRQYLELSDIAVVETINGELMDLLGYKREQPDAVVPRGYITHMRTKRLAGLLSQAYQYLRYRRPYLFFLIWRKWRLGLLKDFLWTVNY